MVSASKHLGLHASRKRRVGGVLALRLLQPFLFLGLLKAFVVTGLQRRLKHLCQPSPGVTVFQAFMVGDLFMALPALKSLQSRLPAGLPLQVLCRPDCIEILKSEGFTAIGLHHPWFLRNRLMAFWTSAWHAWNLRHQATTWALDTDADPRSGFLLRLMGHGKVISYARPGAAFFHETFALAGDPIHQSEKNQAVVNGFCELLTQAGKSLIASSLPEELSENLPVDLSRALSPSNAWAALEQLADSDRSPQQPTPNKKKELPTKLWVMATTRKDTKNWALASWEILLTRLYESGISFQLVDVPDGDAQWRAFANRWGERVPLLRMALPDLWRALQAQTHVITLDNFMGHMAAYAGKKILWINGSSAADHVMPLHWQGQKPNPNGTQVVQVETMPCRPCGHRCTEARHAHCLGDLSVDAVWAQVKAWDIWDE